MDEAAGSGARDAGMAAARDLVPAGYDQVARLEAARAARPHVQVWHAGPYWYGAHPVGGWPWFTRARTDLRTVLDAVGRLAALDDELRALEAARPGWRAYLCPTGTWHAWRGGVHARALTAAELDKVIGAVEAMTTWPEVA